MTMNTASNQPRKERPTQAVEGASSLTCGLTHRQLEDIYEELLGRLDADMVANREQFIEDYVGTMVKHDEMTTLWTDPVFYQQLKQAIREELLPIYDRYQDRRAKETRKLETNTWARYSLWGAGICIGLEAILTEGRGLRPPLLALAAIIGGGLGWGIWCVINARTLQAINRLERGFVQSVKDLIRKQNVSEKYDRFREYTGGELLKAEFDELLSHYTSPAEFWQDYREVRRADPTTAEELGRLNKPGFKGFLALHTQGTYSQEAREQRFNALFLLAHKAFLLADRQNYVNNHLSTFSN